MLGFIIGFGLGASAVWLFRAPAAAMLAQWRKG